jgi:phospholipase/carboxylesterase
LAEQSRASLLKLNWRAMRNRIVSSQSDQASMSDGLSDSDAAGGIHRVSALVEHQLCLFGPEKYEPRYDYPLLVWLHSCHSSEGELENVMPAMSIQNYVGCAPRGPIPSDRSCGRFLWGRSTTAAAVAEEIVFASIESAAEQFSIDRKRVFLGGFGSGATMALRLALRYPEQFAGVVAICGKFPNEDRSLARLEQARQLPMLWLYGEHSTTCSISDVCETLPLLHSAALAVDIRQYPCGDELLTNMLSDTNIWLMEQVTNQPSRGVTRQQETFSDN